MTTQPVNTVYVTVPRQRASRIIPSTALRGGSGDVLSLSKGQGSGQRAGVEYRFVYANRRSFWGWETIWATDTSTGLSTSQEQVRVSDLEKLALSLSK